MLPFRQKGAAGIILGNAQQFAQGQGQVVGEEAADDPGVADQQKRAFRAARAPAAHGPKGAGLDLNYGTEGDTGLNVAAFGTVFGDQFGSLLIAVGLALFAYSTVLGWALYGTRACEFIFGSKAIRPYQIIFIIIIVVGATMDLGLAWDIADTLNGLMAIPNLIAVIALSGVVVRETKRHFANKAEAKKIEEESKQ